MSEVEILIVDTPKAGTSAAAAAGRLQTVLLDLGADVRRVTQVDADVQLIADEVAAVLRRGPGLLALVGGRADVVREGVAAATGREVIDGVPEGGYRIGDDDGVLMLVAKTQVLALPADVDRLADLWRSEVGPALADWFGQPCHVHGELTLLDAAGSAGEALVREVADAHPAVYLKLERHGYAEGTMRVVALAIGPEDEALGAVEAALAAIERDASARRIRVSSTGRVPAEAVGLS